MKAENEDRLKAQVAEAKAQEAGREAVEQKKRIEQEERQASYCCSHTAALIHCCPHSLLPSFTAAALTAAALCFCSHSCSHTAALSHSCSPIDVLSLVFSHRCSQASDKALLKEKEEADAQAAITKKQAEAETTAKVEKAKVDQLEKLREVCILLWISHWCLCHCVSVIMCLSLLLCVSHSHSVSHSVSFTLYLMLLHLRLWLSLCDFSI